jgi:hypothetical protein
MGGKLFKTPSQKYPSEIVSKLLLNFAKITSFLKPFKN